MDSSEFTRRVLDAEPTLYHISKTILKNDHDCADAVQEAILTAFRKLGSLREERYFKTWLCRIMINECYKIHRRSKRYVSYDDYIGSEHYEDVKPETELYTALSKLKDKFRLVITLHYIEGFKQSEIASMLRIPEGTVKSRLSKARTELRALLNGEDMIDEVV